LVDVDPGFKTSTLLHSLLPDSLLKDRSSQRQKESIPSAVGLEFPGLHAKNLCPKTGQSVPAGVVRSLSSQADLPIRATLYSIVEFDLKFLPVPVTAYSQTSTSRWDGNSVMRSNTPWNKAQSSGLTTPRDLDF
jgi:hypothetical protein